MIANATMHRPLFRNLSKGGGGGGGGHSKLLVVD